MLTVALVIGIVVSLFLTELIGLTAGGIIVPGYIALLLDRPATLAVFLAIALATHGVLAVVGSHLMLFGTRRFAFAVLVGLTLSMCVQTLRPVLELPFSPWLGLGYVVPGLVAYHFERQGIVPTLLMIALAAPIVRLGVHLWTRI